MIESLTIAMEAQRKTSYLHTSRSRHVYFTLQNTSTKEHRSFRISKQGTDATFAPDKTVVGLLTGPDNVHNYQNFGFVNDDRTIKIWRKQETQPTYAAYARMISALVLRAHPCTEYTVIAMDACYRCGNPLTVPRSVELGIGPDCAAHLGIPY